LKAGLFSFTDKKDCAASSEVVGKAEPSANSALKASTTKAESTTAYATHTPASTSVVAQVCAEIRLLDDDAANNMDTEHRSNSETSVESRMIESNYDSQHDGLNAGTTGSSVGAVSQRMKQGRVGKPLPTLAPFPQLIGTYGTQLAQETSSVDSSNQVIRSIDQIRKAKVQKTLQEVWAGFYSLAKLLVDAEAITRSHDEDAETDGIGEALATKSRASVTQRGVRFAQHDLSVVEWGRYGDPGTEKQVEALIDVIAKVRTCLLLMQV
jgi:hypothetical protein